MVLLRNKLSLLSAALLLSSIASVTADADASLPANNLVASANALLAAGDKRGALDHFDAAIKKDPLNYLTLFKRGATYLSLGRSSQASADFDAVLSLKPDFEAALLQRAKLKTKGGDWEGAKSDYSAAGAKNHAGEIAEIDGAAQAAKEAFSAEEKKDWDSCVEKAGTAILVAGEVHTLRSLRARCRMQKGDVYEAIGDLTHVAKLNPSSIEPHIVVANLLYFSLGDFDRATTQLRKCLHSDPDSKPCSKLFRRIKSYEKQIGKVRGLREKRLFNSANKILVGTKDEDGTIAEVREDIVELKNNGYINERCPEILLGSLLEMACDGYTEMNKPDKAQLFCDEVLRINPQSIVAILAKAARLTKEDLFEEAIRLLEKAKDEVDGASSDPRVREKLQEAHNLLRRSKNKDYYKVLGVDRDADDRELKKVYRKLTKQYHPDKYRGELSAEEVHKKMSSINEAYEVLSDPELRARFDNGHDPNSQEQPNPFGFGGNPFGGQPFIFKQGGSGEQRFHFRRQGDGGFQFDF